MILGGQTKIIELIETSDYRTYQHIYPKTTYKNQRNNSSAKTSVSLILKLIVVDIRFGEFHMEFSFALTVFLATFSMKKFRESCQK